MNERRSECFSSCTSHRKRKSTCASTSVDLLNQLFTMNKPITRSIWRRFKVKLTSQLPGKQTGAVRLCGSVEQQGCGGINLAKNRVHEHFTQHQAQTISRAVINKVVNASRSRAHTRGSGDTDCYSFSSVHKQQ